MRQTMMNSTEPTKTGSIRRRSDEDYEIEALSKGLLVLEALEGSAFEPVGIQRIVDRTKLPKDVVRRCLFTLRLKGYAVQNDRFEWTIGQRFIRFAAKAAAKGGV